MIAVIAALHQELAWIRKQFPWESAGEQDGIRFYSGSLGGKLVTLIASGVGTERAAQATRLAMERWSVGAVVSIGFAGGIAPEAVAGRLILPDNVRKIRFPQAEGGAFRAKGGAAPDSAPSTQDSPLNICADARLLALARSAASRVKVEPLGGTLLTVPAVVSTKEAKKQLHVRFGAVVVDMESAAVGEVCAEHSVPCLYLRCVTDGPEDEIPIAPEISAAFRGRINVPALLAGIARRPKVALAIWRLFWRAHRASNSLGVFVRAFCHDYR
jgi:adenosylhomocysteine nucleosidase